MFEITIVIRESTLCLYPWYFKFSNLSRTVNCNAKQGHSHVFTYNQLDVFFFDVMCFFRLWGWIFKDTTGQEGSFQLSLWVRKPIDKLHDQRYRIDTNEAINFQIDSLELEPVFVCTHVYNHFWLGSTVGISLHFGMTDDRILSLWRIQYWCNASD